MRYKPAIIATAFLALIALLGWIQPPQAAYPFVKVRNGDGVELSVLLDAQPTLDACWSTVSALGKKMCPSGNRACSVEERSCLISLGSRLQAIRGSAPLQDSSLRFATGDLLLEAADPIAEFAICEAMQDRGFGRCFFAGVERTPRLGGAGAKTSVLTAYRFSWPQALQASGLALAVSLLATLALLLTKRWHGRFSLDLPNGVQKFHVEPTPRIGGVAILAGLGASAALISAMNDAGMAASLIASVLASSMVAFAFGLMEDLSGRIGVLARLLATMASGVLMWWLTGISLRSVQIAPIDGLLLVTFVSVLFTAVAMGGLANAINIIDGFHGLAAGAVCVMLAAFAAIAYQVGDTKILLFCLMLIGATLGFLLINFPWGGIFLGDGGAYILGFLLATVAVLLSERNPSVSPWASLLVCGYPVAETLFTMYRRAKNGFGLGNPDGNHMHSLLRAVSGPGTSALSANLRNAAVSPPLWALTSLPAVAAVFFYDRARILAISFCAFCALYWLCYRLLVAKLGPRI